MRHPLFANVTLGIHFLYTFDDSSWQILLINACQMLGLIMHLIFGLPRRPTVVLMHDFRNIVRLSLKGTGCPDDVRG